MQNRSNRNENRRPYSSQGSYSSRNESSWGRGDGNRNSNFSSYNEDENARDYNMEGGSTSSPRRDWDYEGGTHRSQGRGNRNDNRYGSERYGQMNEDRYANNWQATSDYDSGRNTSRDFNMRDREEHMDQDRYGRNGGYFSSNTGRGSSSSGGYGRNYESSRFNEDRESDSSPSYGSSRGDYSSQNYSDRDYSGSQSYSGRGDRFQESNYGSGANSRSYGRTESSRGTSFEGRGPKSYTRSDDRIKEDVCDMLTRHSEIDANDIEVEVKNGEVTLSGSVSERRMKHMAEDLAERVSSVKDVTNNIRVQRESTHDWSSQTDKESDSSEQSASAKGGSAGKRGSASQSTSSSTSAGTGTTQNPNH
ncbi:BON domain-containing protein [Bdellovibrio sp. SKB1291214]|uniref:BON domain-containing protein n=1 Tax=Bdellovibrio sp. SKB1291214 TaxID=1732569 RepID=UPI000B51E3BF|nr:BON domain-containing protein [Bdellovibrio sp. SKB1291214]UYL07359.1 BON domain-containing protein [Bdellovibrio sp. SKB1291214]